jgi:Spy/CpxP family protein refolding chaperone
LDQAIYADAINESEIEARFKELQTAQADIARLRATGELEVRKILTAEQLVKFRDLRRRFAEMRENFNERRKDTLRDGNKNAPNRRFSRQLRKIPNN